MSECDKIQLSYFIHNQSDKIKSKRNYLTYLAEAYYCTKNGKAKGILTLTEHLILFDPVKCVENEAFVNAIRTYYFIERPEEVSGCN
jgi:CRISPR/Cas system CMR subunit Cmr4 (Cas7 group RAMP superfamily)